MSNAAGSIALFDLGGTLASLRVSPGTHRVRRASVFPDVLPALRTLRAEGVRLGIVTGIEAEAAGSALRALARAGMLSHFEEKLVFHGRTRSPALFEEAVHRVHDEPRDADTPPPALLFVGPDADKRIHAHAADVLTAPHPALALAVLRGEPLRYLRIRVPPDAERHDWRSALLDLPLVLLHEAAEPGSALAVRYAIADASTTARLDDLGFWVDRLGAENEPQTTDLYLLHDDLRAASGFLAPEGNSAAFFARPPHSTRILCSTSEGLMVALPGGRSPESYHFAGALHGHTRRLSCCPSLPRPREARLLHAANGAPPLLRPLDAAEVAVLRERITTGDVQTDIERYSGARPAAPGDVKLRSRHINHEDNSRAVEVFATDLDALGLRAFLDPVIGDGQHNVMARVRARGGRSGIVVVSAHLDSTGIESLNYISESDRAPGADDDASGMAGVLAVARAVLALRTRDETRAHAELRFVLFNAEEQGMLGSGKYARDARKAEDDIVAVFQMDMIGHHSCKPVPRPFEVHAGDSTLPGVQPASLEIAAVLHALAAQVSPDLDPPQVYPPPGGKDVAEARSDHLSFHACHYAACLICEDAFPGPGSGAPIPQPNRNYHKRTDRADTTNPEYAADIARAVAAAAWRVATG